LDSSCELFDNISADIYKNKCILEINNDTKKNGNVFQAGFFFQYYEICEIPAPYKCI